MLEQQNPSANKKVIPLVVKWKVGKKQISAKDQAKQIIDKFGEEIKAGRKVAIT